MMLRIHIDGGDIAKLGLMREEMDLRWAKAVLALWTNCVSGTPIDTGFARGNWYAVLGVKTTNENAPPPPPKDAAPASVPPPPMPGFLTDTFGKHFFIGNSAAYIRKLEAGHSPQNAGWVAAAAARFPIDVEEAFAGLK